LHKIAFHKALIPPVRFYVRQFCPFFHHVSVFFVSLVQFRLSITNQKKHHLYFVSTLVFPLCD